MDPENFAVVIDNGSGVCKAGVAGEDYPKACFPTIVGKPKIRNLFVPQDLYVGEEAQSKLWCLKLTRPIEYGVITDWENMEKIWHHCYFNELRVPSEEHPILLTEASFNPKVNRERMTHIFFETFNVPSFYLSNQTVLSIFAAGRVNGLGMNIGDGVTETVPVIDGYTLPYAIAKMEFSGRDLTEYMLRLLCQTGAHFSLPGTSSEINIARDIKEKHCYVARDFYGESNYYYKGDCNHTLPDGNILTLGEQQLRCPEVLFQPSLLRFSFAGIHEMAFESIMKSDVEFRKELFNNIVLSGGTTMLPGFPERLRTEVEGLAPNTSNVKIVSSVERKYSAWIGGSILSSLSTFQIMMITKDEFEECGPTIVHRKCF